MIQTPVDEKVVFEALTARPNFLAHTSASSRLLWARARETQTCRYAVLATLSHISIAAHAAANMPLHLTSLTRPLYYASPPSHLGSRRKVSALGLSCRPWKHHHGGPPNHHQSYQAFHAPEPRTMDKCYSLGDRSRKNINPIFDRASPHSDTRGGFESGLPHPSHV
jgi:hypothetical protein